MLGDDGRAWFRGALQGPALGGLARLFSREGAGERVARTSEIEGLLSDVTALARRVMAGARPVRIVAFDKSEENNWALAWHQDRVVAVAERLDAPGFEAWTRKHGVWHAEPPIDVLEAMMFARIHLDDARADSGCMQIALGSHRFGKVSSGRASEFAERCVIEDCVATAGDVMFAEMLMLHRSSASRSPHRRRALRVDYAASALPHGLAWA
jgi:ectoine hydroxylase-related dioxygenase (phytanoyl-CoA dioxygenase family)